MFILILAGEVLTRRGNISSKGSSRAVRLMLSRDWRNPIMLLIAICMSSTQTMP